MNRQLNRAKVAMQECNGRFYPAVYIEVKMPSTQMLCWESRVTNPPGYDTLHEAVPFYLDLCDELGYDPGDMEIILVSEPGPDVQMILTEQVHKEGS